MVELKFCTFSSDDKSRICDALANVTLNSVTAIYVVDFLEELERHFHDKELLEVLKSGSTMATDAVTGAMNVAAQQSVCF
jgi:hypothetical protein